MFAALLAALGHRVTLFSAFSLGPDRVPGPDYHHLLLLVDDTWLADVGNGASWLHPVPFAPGINSNGHIDVQVCRDGDLWWTSERRPGGEWEVDWGWRARPRQLLELLPRCRYQEHEPASSFRARRLAVLSVADGRIVLENGVFSETGHADRTIDSTDERRLLAERFGIVLPDQPWTYGDERNDG